MFNDDDIVYPPGDPRTGQLPNRDIGQLSWSPDDSWLSFYETDPAEDSYIVLVSPSGKFLRKRLATARNDPGKIEWADSSHFQVDAFGKGVGHLVRYKFVVNKGEMRESVQPVQ